ncbi:MAG TPA: hypothetical protein VKM55_15510 [Candidatus Lokiarchaeia archaeon]|nr:hypothetical protein [Candidatus Lokiarchaeia archaeon]
MILFAYAFKLDGSITMSHATFAALRKTYRTNLFDRRDVCAEYIILAD